MGDYGHSDFNIYNQQDYQNGYIFFIQIIVSFFYLLEFKVVKVI